VGIRISPHFYNTMDEIDRVMAEMAAIVHTKAYDVGAVARSVVT
jgi:selenocysteine lyase/cysteine desulfurase